MSRIARVLNFQPITTVGLINAIHTLMLGLGYISADYTEFGKTLLADNVSQMMPLQLFGLICLLIGSVSAYALATKAKCLIQRTSGVQTFLWMFVTFAYFLEGEAILGLVSGLTWAFISFYIGFFYKDIDEWNEVIIDRRKKL